MDRRKLFAVAAAALALIPGLAKAKPRGVPYEDLLRKREHAAVFGSAHLVSVNEHGDIIVMLHDRGRNNFTHWLLVDGNLYHLDPADPDCLEKARALAHG